MPVGFGFRHAGHRHAEIVGTIRFRGATRPAASAGAAAWSLALDCWAGAAGLLQGVEDRKSTRLNSSHRTISYAVFCLIRRAPSSPRFPYTTLFRSIECQPMYAGRLWLPPRWPSARRNRRDNQISRRNPPRRQRRGRCLESGAGLLGGRRRLVARCGRSEEHTSELQSPYDLVCRLLLDPARTKFSPLSLHDALPIYRMPAHVCRSALASATLAIGTQKSSGQSDFAAQPAPPPAPGPLLGVWRWIAGRAPPACCKVWKIGRAHV